MSFKVDKHKAMHLGEKILTCLLDAELENRSWSHCRGLSAIIFRYTAAAAKKTPQNVGQH